MEDIVKSKLNELLTVRKDGRIFELVGKMQLLCDLFKSQKELKNLYPFTVTYYFVTKRVADYYVKQLPFEDFDKVEKLDLFFATQYFDPLKGFIFNSQTQAPWEKYLEHSKKKHAIPFVQMFLGIHTHINADLPIALYENKIENHYDFELINQVLLEVLPSVMAELAFHEHDVFGLGGVMLKKFVLEEFQHIVVKWRRRAWENYKKITPQNYDECKSLLYCENERIAKRIEEIFSIRNIKNIFSFVDDLNDLECIRI